MSPITTKRPEEEEEDFIEDVEDEEEEQVSAPPVSDSRRRRKMKRGELVVEVPDEVQMVGKDRPTPSQRTEVVESKNPVVRAYRGVVEYWHETKSELGKVAWLNREELMRLTYIVIVVTTISSVFLGFVGFMFALLTQAMSSSSGSVPAGIATMILIVGVAGAWLFRERLFGGHFE